MGLIGVNTIVAPIEIMQQFEGTATSRKGRIQCMYVLQNRRIALARILEVDRPFDGWIIGVLNGDDFDFQVSRWVGVRGRALQPRVVQIFLGATHRPGL